MLQKFSVEGFKNFASKIEFDLTAGNYSFNNNVVNNNILNTAIIYGDNASGKSNLGLAVMDIMTHLTDNERYNDKYSKHYLNLESSPEFAKFEYTFNFSEHIVKYNYAKQDYEDIVYEELFIDDELIIKYDRETQQKEINIEDNHDLNFAKLRNDQSLVKLAYVYSTSGDNLGNSVAGIFNKFIKFVESMLSFDSVSTIKDIKLEVAK